MRSLKLVGSLIVVAVLAAVFYVYSSPTTPSSPSVSVAKAETTSPPPVPYGILIPVQGVKREQLTDTWGQSRGGGARVHEAIDIMAAGGTPVVAAFAGRIEKLFTSKLGGLTIYQRGGDPQWQAYYAHLRGYAPGLKEGQSVQQGQLLGYVGDTGDAGPGNYHLHFALNRMQPGQGWWQGTAINPYPILAGTPAAR